MNFPFVTLPLDAPTAVHLSQHSMLRISVTPEGLRQTEVLNRGKVVATFRRPARPSQAHPITQHRPVRAANEATMRSTARELPSWWSDEDFLNEPLEELGEFA